MIVINVDGENDGLLHPWGKDKKGNVMDAATKIHCIDARENKATTSRSFDKDNLEEFIEYIKEKAKEGLLFVGHNIVGYDLPLWEKILGWDYEINMETKGYVEYPDHFLGCACRFVDTYILSRMLDPDRKAHSVEAFAELHGEHKVEVEDWKNLPLSVYKERCSEDTRIQDCYVYEDLLKEAKQFGKNIRTAYEREKAVEFIIGEQKARGVLFNQDKARIAITTLDELKAGLAAKIEPLLPSRVLPKSKQPKFPASPFNKDNSVSANGSKFCKAMGVMWDAEEDYLTSGIERAGELKGKERQDYLIACGFCAETASMTMADQQDIKKFIMSEYGWKPEYWNHKKLPDGRMGEKTTPKFHDQKKLCPDLERLGSEVAFVKDIMLWLTYRSRRNVILSENGTGWLTHPRLEMDGRIPADANTIGALTKRFTHKGVANVAGVDKVFGKESRELFCVPEGRKMVGWDAAGLEDRLKAHYCFDYPGGREFAEKLLDPDFDSHGENVLDWFGLVKGDDGFDATRTRCKTGLYALTFGCKEPKFAQSLGIPLEEGKIKYHAWWTKNKPLLLFKTDIEAAWKRDGKVLTSLDGSPLRPRKGHALVNTMIQNAGVVVMKEAMILCHNEIKRLELDSFQVIHYHDEQQNESAEECAELVGQIGVWSIKEAGERLGIKVPMLADYKVGMSWADTH